MHKPQNNLSVTLNSLPKIRNFKIKKLSFFFFGLNQEQYKLTVFCTLIFTQSAGCPISTIAMSNLAMTNEEQEENKFTRFSEILTSITIDTSNKHLNIHR